MGTVLGRYHGGDVPQGCVVMGDSEGEWLLYAPDLVAAMRHDCPICRGDE